MGDHRSRAIKIYTDGGCGKNPGGVGGWAFRLIDGDRVVEGSGSVPRSTNNRMELTAAIRGLEALQEQGIAPRGMEVEVFTDSQYLSRGMSEWIARWVRQNWTLRDGSPVKNADLWKQLLDLTAHCKVSWKWIQGHADDPDNVRVDSLVKKVIEEKTRRISADSKSSPPVVKFVRKADKPGSITISRAQTGERIEVNWVHLNKLIEDLLKALREGEES